MSQTDSSTIASRTISSSFYSVISSAFTLTLGFIRFVLLLYFLLPEDFGVVTQAMFFVALAAQLRLPGLDLAIIQRETVDEPVRRTYFSMKMGFLIVSVLLMALATPTLGRLYGTMPLLSGILLSLLGVEIIKGMNGVQEALLRRELAFQKIAAADIVSAISMTIIVPFLAWRGYGAWSLVAEALVGQLARGGIVWIFGRLWWPKPGWDRAIAADLWQFSNKLWGNSVLSFVTDRFDDFWIGGALGSQPLGYYSRAYEAARYPRYVVATPLVTVFYSTYARLQGDRPRLSQAFFRLSSLMVRVSFGFSLVLILVAPELISLLGESWQPMLVTFQLMIIYTLLDPLAVGAGDLLIAIGRPDLPFRTKVFQAVVFIPAVIVLGNWLGIEGVAWAANLMVGLGALVLFRLTHRFVDYSARRLWFWPIVGLALTGTAVLWLNPFWVSLSPWLALLGKVGLIFLIYGGLLFIVERDDFKRSYELVWHWLRPFLAELKSRKKS
ncbi:MAG: oligosaccharide flippase family protein [Ardenticatenaceae bacterium]|nr:oligosaccharide flippase family protein [Anaerolineales bacterium]MCB8940714.1 oligosaccharide flippase family protein [Ardenticatenaceae bacterium]MCB8972053.1 oligosaccharide flippase family protein [Ardenticatenaceae bacterium]